MAYDFHYIWFELCDIFDPETRKLEAMPEVLVQCITSESQEDNFFFPGQQMLVGFDRYYQLCLQK